MMRFLNRLREGEKGGSRRPGIAVTGLMMAALTLGAAGCNVDPDPIDEQEEEIGPAIGKPYREEAYEPDYPDYDEVIGTGEADRNWAAGTGPTGIQTGNEDFPAQSSQATPGVGETPLETDSGTNQEPYPNRPVVE